MFQKKEETHTEREREREREREIILHRAKICTREE